MPSQVLTTVENNFTKGLVTEFTGLDFPENAATDCDNSEFSIVGDVTRRLGINFEDNYTSVAINRVNQAVSSYKWNNAGGDGVTEVVVTQIGGTLRFYKSSSATAASPLSTTILASTVDISSYVATNGTFDASIECDFSDGNGYLFVYHSSCDPFYCTYNAGVITSDPISLQTRDFIGVPELGISDNTRPITLSDSHSYNLVNQGWTVGAAWTTTSSTVVSGSAASSPDVFVVAGGLPVTIGDKVNIYCTDPISSRFIPPGAVAKSGIVTAYAGTNMTINITSAYGGFFASRNYSSWSLVQINLGHLDTWKTAIGNYPSNADIWWNFKNTSDVFDPTTRVSNVTVSTTPAPKGHYILGAFDQNRNSVSSLSTLTSIATTKRPRTGTWFQGRVWYTGVDAQQVANGTAPAFSWTENIYFSQIVQTPREFGLCYQTNDPTSDTLFDLLPTDGGVIKIQGCGAIYKLFPIQNALLVFAANGVWYLSGSQGVGFTANDYTIVKLSSVRSISGTSFVNVNGTPYFWNEEGIYAVEPAKQGTSLVNNPLHVNPLEVNPVTVGTILTFYESIPVSSKKYARGVYSPIDYTIKWIYRDTESTTTADRYEFNRMLNFNAYNKAFFPYTISGPSSLNSILYVANPGGSGAPEPTFKFLASTSSSGSVSFAEEWDTAYIDWGATNYTSYFVTGYKLHGQGQRRFQIPYVYIFSRGDTATSYKIQGIWDFASSASSGRWSTLQQVNNFNPNFGMVFRRHRIRGQGIVLQFKISSSDGQPYDIMGWSSFETQNTGV